MATTIMNGISHNALSIDLTTLLRNEPYRWLQPTLQQQQAAVLSAKFLLDPLACDISQAQISRRNENRRKRKRGGDEVEDPVLQSRQIYTNGLAVRQVWEQARRILDAACGEIERELDEHLPQLEQPLLTEEETETETDEDADNDLDMEVGGSVDVEDESDIGATPDLLTEDNEPSIYSNQEDIEDDAEGSASDDDNLNFEPQATYKEDPNKLNDGFFSIDDFNR
ncbi:U3 snoRNP protein, partial [Neophaeococcomyces mojaviensis]